MDYQVLVKSRQKKVPIKRIVEVAKNHLRYRKAIAGILEVELVSKNKIKQINSEYRNLDYPTDVLSFPTAEFPSPKSESFANLYGTIFLSCDIIKSNAVRDKKSFQEEFDFILCHGIDHLLGIHHKE